MTNWSTTIVQQQILNQSGLHRSYVFPLKLVFVQFNPSTQTNVFWLKPCKDARPRIPMPRTGGVVDRKDGALTNLLVKENSRETRHLGNYLIITAWLYTPKAYANGPSITTNRPQPQNGYATRTDSFGLPMVRPFAHINHVQVLLCRALCQIHFTRYSAPSHASRRARPALLITFHTCALERDNAQPMCLNSRLSPHQTTVRRPSQQTGGHL